jgi:phosphate transport system protein
MAKHLEREIANLKKKILNLVAVVEEATLLATQAVERRDAELAENIITNDIQIDNLEVEIEEDCLKILALNQPVAIDLRFIIVVLKINNDLERIGDLAVNIAERAVFLAAQPEPPVLLDFAAMMQKAKSMLKESLDALVNLNSGNARKVCNDDVEVDAMNRDMFKKIQQSMQQYPDQIEQFVHLLSISRHLERIADHATNIAEDVIYMIDGEIVRHKPEKYRDQS